MTDSTIILEQAGLEQTELILKGVGEVKDGCVTIPYPSYPDIDYEMREVKYSFPNLLLKVSFIGQITIAMVFILPTYSFKLMMDTYYPVIKIFPKGKPVTEICLQKKTYSP